MKFESAPISFGGVSFDGGELLLYAVSAVILMLVVFGVRREMAMFAVLAGIVGLMLAQ